MRNCARSSWLLRLAAVVFLLTASSSATRVASAQSSFPETASPALVQALEGGARARVIFVFDVEEMRAPAAATEAGRAQVAAQIGAQTARILGDFAPGEFEVVRRFKHVNAMAGEIDEAGLARLLADPSVLRVDLDEGGSGSLDQARPLAEIDAVQATGLTGSGVTVAVLDSGYDSDHADLSDDLVGEACFCRGGGGCCPFGGSTQTGAGAAEDDNGHGTNVTGIITSSGAVGPLGSAPDVEVVAVKVLDRNGGFCCSSDVVAGLDWIIANRPDVDIVNASLATFALFTGDCDNAHAATRAFATAINTLRAKGVTTFVASGNNGSGTHMSAPACVANAISVGAVWDSNVGGSTAADQVTFFSNSNASTDLFAPGAPTTSSGIGGGTSTLFGTSQASPLAAGCAALLLEGDPTLTPAQIEAQLEASPTLVTDETNGLSFPRVDCFDALGITVAIDIKPGSGVNPVNPMSGGVIPVAILGSDRVDVLDVDPETLAFGASAALAHPGGPHYEDVNDDGLTDLLGHFMTGETGIAFGDTKACLTGELDGTPFEACDAIRTVPACGIGFELAFLVPPIMRLRSRRRRRSP